MQEITIHVHVLVRVLPTCRCTFHSLPLQIAVTVLTCTLGGFIQGLNTTVTLVQICQNNRFDFSLLQNTYLGLLQAGTSVIGIVVYWYIQRRWKIDSKKMARLLVVILLRESVIDYGDSVHRDNYCGCFAPSLGHDWHLDGQVWVGRASSRHWPGQDMTEVCIRRYHKKWEFWVHSFVFGVFQEPYFSYSQTVMAELSPPGFEYMVRAVRKSRFRSPMHAL